MISFVLIVANCVDRIDLSFGSTASRVVIDGFISTEPGPYSIKVSESIDIESTYEVVRPITLKSIVVLDNIGNIDSLTQRNVGDYYTHEDGIRGTPGRAYKVRFETLDGRIYESIYDTLIESSGAVESVQQTFVTKNSLEGNPTHGFEITFDAIDNEQSGSFHMWRSVATYQVETNPRYHRKQCNSGDIPFFSDNLPADQQCGPFVDCGCVAPLPCSGWALDPLGKYQSLKPCECCTCWVSIYNDAPIVPDQNLYGKKLTNVFADYIPLTYYNFMFKMHVQVDQLTVSRNAYLFYRAIASQQAARGSLFQPVTGKLPVQFEQVSGHPVPTEGIFFAASITSNSIFITRSDIPDLNLIPTIETYPFANKKILGSCLDFTNSTISKPPYWN
jgi:hypothetical protein